MAVLRPLLHYLTSLSTASAKAFVPSLLARLYVGDLGECDTPVFEADQDVAEKLEQTLWADQDIEVLRLKEAVARAVVVSRSFSSLARLASPLATLQRKPGLPADLAHEAALQQLALSRTLIREVLTELAAILGSEELDGAISSLRSRVMARV